jgi:hypothetical protein
MSTVLLNPTKRQTIKYIHVSVVVSFGEIGYIRTPDFRIPVASV